MVRTLPRAIQVAFLCMPIAVTAQQATTAATVPVWDVISIKPHRPGDTSSSVTWDDTTYAARNISVKNLISDATEVKRWLITGLPPELTSQRYDIDAKFTEPDLNLLEHLTKDQRRTMLMGMLQQSFGLKMHDDTKMQPIFEMTVLPDGPKFKPSPEPPAPKTGGKPQPNTNVNNSDGAIVASGITMPNLAAFLSYEAERTVVDKTGLNADYGYNLELHWTPERRANGNDNGTGADAPPPFLEAIREQLGLKMTASKAEVKTVVVDTIHPPEAN